MKISSIFVAFIENMNFKKQRIKSEPSDNIYEKWTFQKHKPTSNIFVFLKILSESFKKEFAFLSEFLKKIAIWFYQQQKLMRDSRILQETCSEKQMAVLITYVQLWLISTT